MDMRLGVVWIAASLAGVFAADGAFASDRWVTHPAAIVADADHKPAALQFRRVFDLARVPRHFFVRISADNRYVLYVNGKRVAAGPSRGDLEHWRYERLDLTAHLRAGRNVIAAQVWNDGQFAPLAQISARTAFLMSAENKEQGIVNSGPQWQVRIDGSRTPGNGMDQLNKQVGPTYYVAGAPEAFDGRLFVTDWALAHSSAKDRVAAVDAVRESETQPWKLIADELPQMAYARAGGGRVVRSHGVVAGKFPNGTVTVAANSEAVILLDAGQVQAAYPRLTVSGGRDAKIAITYVEALYGDDKQRLHDRAQVAGGTALGLTDTFMPDGRPHMRFEPFWWRAWRFAEIRVKTGDQPVRLERFERFLTGFPFQTRARFVSNDSELNRIWQIGWNTVQLDAHETFMDTAYWEQLQYVGDTRIEALVVAAVTGDNRLPAKAITMFDASRLNGDITQSAWPSRGTQWIPPFALIWVGMVHDYWMHQTDSGIVASVMPGVRATLDWYTQKVGENGLVDRTPGWNFIDWRPNLQHTPNAGVGASPARLPNDADDTMHRNACILSLFYIGALQQAAELELAVGDAGRHGMDDDQAARISMAVQKQCWSPEHRLYADGPDLLDYSQQANILAVLYDVAPKSDQAAILDRIMVKNGGIDPPAGLTGVTYYFAFYLAQALDHAGLADRYLELLAPWRSMAERHFTTWPETPDPSRSDSHAWSAHPTVDLLGLVAGIQPSSPGFASVRIAPHLGSLTDVDAAMPLPQGLAEVKYIRRGEMLTATIKLPARVSGTFVWAGQTTPLHPGTNVFTATAQKSR